VRSLFLPVFMPSHFSVKTPFQFPPGRKFGNLTWRRLNALLKRTHEKAAALALPSAAAPEPRHPPKNFNFGFRLSCLSFPLSVCQRPTPGYYT
jgi:hypothetical protein